MRRPSASLIGFLVIGATLALLVWLPPFLQRRAYRLNLPQGGGLQRSVVFPMDRKLTVIWSDGKAAKQRETTLGELVKTAPGGLIINFWATWCPPCLEEMPSLEALDRQLRQAGGPLPRLVTISVDEKGQDVLKLFASLGSGAGPAFPVLHDPGAALAQAVGSSKFPETYLVTAGGQVKEKWIGPQNWLSRDVLQTFRQ